MVRKIVLLMVVLALAAAGVWAFFRYRSVRRSTQSRHDPMSVTAATLDGAAWYRAVELAKAERSAELGGTLEVPPELKHYEERYWFLATQVAEIEKHRVHTCQDYLDLAAMVQRGEIVPVAAVTDTYVLLGVGQRADDSEFTKHEDEEAQPLSAEQLAAEYQSLNTLARNFNGRSYDLNNPSDRLALKMNLLSTLRPEALRVMEEVAAAYQRQFNRQLLVSSLVRPEQYQHSLRRVNRNAVTIESPPHSTGLAFDIDYRYMSVAEQNFVMKELARLKNDARIEVIRERNANYHVFAFVNGSRPSDDLIQASLEKAGAPPAEEAHHTTAKATPKAAPKAKVKRGKATRRARNDVRKTRRRRR